MPRFYFDVHDGADLMRDDDGSEFASVDAAIQGAITSVGEIGRNVLAKGRTSDVAITVRDEQSQRVCTVTASMMVERHKPPSHDPHPWSV